MNWPLRRLFLAVGGDDNLRTQLIRAAVGVGGLKVLSLSLSLAVAILLARILGPAAFGQYAYVMSLMTILSLPLDSGIRQLVTREVAVYHREENWALLQGVQRRTHQWILLTAAGIGVVLGAIAASRATWTPNDRWTLIIAGLSLLPFLGLNAHRGATLRGLGYIFQAHLPDLLAKPGFALTIVVLLLTSGYLNPATAILGHTMGAALAFAIGAVLLRRRWPVEARGKQPVFRSSAWAAAWIPFTLLVGTSLLNNQIGILLIGWLSDDEEVAALRVAIQGAQLVLFPLVVANMVIGPHIARTHRDGNQQRLQQLSRQSARGALLVAAPVALPMIFFGTSIVAFVFGIDYVELTVTPLATLATAQLVSVAFGSAGLFLNMSGLERYSLFGLIIALFLNLIFAIILIPNYGATGAALAAAIGLITTNIIHAFNVWRHLKLRPTAL